MLLNLKKITKFTIRVSLESSPKFLSTLTRTSSSNPNVTNPNPNYITPLTVIELKTLVLKQYTKGKFTNLIRNVVALPSVLLTACKNLNTSCINELNSSDSFIDSVSKRFPIEEIGLELGQNRFDLESCCIRISPSGSKGESLILPNLKLKVLIEAIRMILEVIYDDRFATFSYGGRVGMGRHTAIRYLKNTVENPNWWFTVQFNRSKFEDDKHVSKLCMILEEKIKDEIFIEILKRLFKCEAIRIELNGCYLGRGFPQESGLSSMLVNIYFNKLDQEIKELRLCINKEHPRIDPNKLEGESKVFHNPRRIFMVRYLDEILVITSGSKYFTLDLKNRVLNFLEENLEVKADRFRTTIHSAISEKIDFLGMELRAVTPSFLRPLMSEKAIRARKKYLRQKEVRLKELRNAKETNRKKLGMKILTHVFKKVKRSNGFKFDFHIENEVREIFNTWAHEAAHEFFHSLDERQDLHRQLSAGDFLSLPRIREQLPHDLVRAYDKFQEQVDKHLNPIKAINALKEEERRVEEEEQRIYTKRTIEDLTNLCMKIDAPIELIRKAVKMVGFTNHMGRPRPIEMLFSLEDVDIIKWYAGIGKRWLDFYCCCHNFAMVKTVVTYHLRFSCILTLAEKHESTKQEAIRHYSKDLKIEDVNNGVEEVYFPTEREIKLMGDKNLVDPKYVDGVLSMVLIRLACDETPYRCVAHFCDKLAFILYRIRLLQNRLNVDPKDEKKCVLGMGAIHGSLDKKCVPLCCDHVSDLYMGNLCLQDIDCTSFVNVD